jgi:hypothetical protein
MLLERTNRNCRKHYSKMSGVLVTERLAISSLQETKKNNERIIALKCNQILPRFEF